MLIDTSFIEQVGIHGICPCATTMTDLGHNGSLKEVPLATMDACPDGMISDARFEDGKAYYLPGIAGIFLQKDESSEYISKLHLTKAYQGELPNRWVISLDTLRFKAVQSMYPHFRYEDRACSTYWWYTNDTISFYFKKDSTITYPIDETKYADELVEAVELTVWCSRMYGPEYDDGVVYERPLYAPFSVSHVNTYAIKVRTDIATRLKELTSFGKKSNYDFIRLGKWLEYSADHKLVAEEYYDNKGRLVRKVK